MKFTIAAATPGVVLFAVLMSMSSVSVRAARGQDQDDRADSSNNDQTPSIRVRDPDEKPAKPARKPVETTQPEAVEAPATTTQSDQEPRDEEPRAKVARRTRDVEAEPSPQPDHEPAAPARSKHKIAIEGASLKGIQPGRSKREELVVAWGPAKEVRNVKGASQHFYKVEMFDRVMVTVVKDTVTSIAVYFEKPMPADDVARQLELSQIEPATVYSPKGQLLGQAYPERGVLFGFAEHPTEKLEVSQIVIEPIDPQSFLLRAESHLKDRPSKSLVDVGYALQIDSHSGRAYWIRAQALLAQCNLTGALKSAETATTLDRHEPEFQLTLAKILCQVADYQAAKDVLEQVLENHDAPTVVRARAFCQRGDCLAALPSHDYQQALKDHVQAIKLAEPLAIHDQVAIRRAAKLVMLDAHLSVAHDIAWGKWQQKQAVVPKWLERAVALADDLVKHEHETKELHFRVHERALTAIAGVRDVPEAGTWVAATLAIGKQLIAETKDPMAQEAFEWRLGLAMTDALVIEQAKGDPDKALEYGKLAANYLKPTNKAVEKWPNRDYVIGRLYYRIGAIYALKRQDHTEALVWYEQAVTLLEGPVPSSALADAGRQGETFVSMAVSYWETGARVEALRLTNQGTKLMEKAVDEGLMEKTALVVPYGNLASMHHEMGDTQHAEEFAELAENLEKTRQKTTQK